jgi:hypothetical protein
MPNDLSRRDFVRPSAALGVAALPAVDLPEFTPPAVMIRKAVRPVVISDYSG